jgi:hypothetical protein
MKKRRSDERGLMETDFSHGHVEVRGIGYKKCEKDDDNGARERHREQWEREPGLGNERKEQKNEGRQAEKRSVKTNREKECEDKHVPEQTDY